MLFEFTGKKSGFNYFLIYNNCREINVEYKT